MTHSKSSKRSGTSGTRKSRRLQNLGSEAPLVPAVGGQTNKQLLADILQGHYPDHTPLTALGFGLDVKAALGAQIRRENIPVRITVIQQCRTVGDILDEMNEINPDGA